MTEEETFKDVPHRNGRVSGYRLGKHWSAWSSGSSATHVVCLGMLALRDTSQRRINVEYESADLLNLGSCSACDPGSRRASTDLAAVGLTQLVGKPRQRPSLASICFTRPLGTSPRKRCCIPRARC